MSATTPARVDALGVLLSAVGAAAIVFLPFVLFKANRILPGDARSLFQILPLWSAVGFYAVLVGIAAVAIGVARVPVRLAAALAGLVVIALAIGAAGDVLTPVGNKVVRIAPGGGFWILLIAVGLLATDAITRLKPGPAMRVLLLAAFGVVAALAFSSGAFDHLSIMREYSVNAERFGRELRQHVFLALGSLAAAIAMGLPLGIACHRIPRMRAGVLGALNVVQTIPSIALFGILMVPLGALAAAFPLAASLGIRGIGAAPAIVALFLYALLPVVANTVAGLARVSPAIVEAARGMGLTDRQVLTDIELKLAMPVILTGIRIVLVQNIGLATVAALIGAGGLGAFVFQGIGQTAMDLVLLGAIPTVALAFSAAVLLDALIDVMKRSRP